MAFSLTQSDGDGKSNQMQGIYLKAYHARSFYGQTPLALACILFAARNLPSSMRTAAPGFHKTSVSISRIRDLDFAGLFSLALTVLSLLLLLQAAGAQTIDHPEWVYATMLVLAISLVAFMAIELCWAAEPIVPMDLMGSAFGAYCIGQTLALTARSAVSSSSFNHSMEFSSLVGRE